MKKWQYWVLGIHTLIILYVLWGDLNAKGENWSWLGTFIVDFPLPMIFYPVIDFIVQHLFAGSHTAYLVIQYSAHLVIGGAWWILLAGLAKKGIDRLNRTDQTPLT